MIYPAAPLVEILLRLAKCGSQDEDRSLRVVEGFVMLER